MKRFSEKKKIKVIGDIVKENATFLSPNTLEIGDNLIESVYPTQFFILDNKLIKNIESADKRIVKSKRTVSQNMEIPDLSIPLTDVLNLYDVDNFDELIELINKLMHDNKSEYTIYRLVNIYTRIFYNDLKKANNTLIKIFKLIFDNYKIDETKLSSFFKKWFEKHDEEDFDLNICNDVKNFLSNKYE